MYYEPYDGFKVKCVTENPLQEMETWFAEVLKKIWCNGKYKSWYSGVCINLCFLRGLRVLYLCLFKLYSYNVYIEVLCLEKMRPIFTTLQTHFVLKNWLRIKIQIVSSLWIVAFILPSFFKN